MDNTPNDFIENMNARVDKLVQDVEALTELVARMHVDLYTNIEVTSAGPDDAEVE